MSERCGGKPGEPEPVAPRDKRDTTWRPCPGCPDCSPPIPEARAALSHTPEPVASPPEAGERSEERIHRLALTAQGPIESVIGLLKLKGEVATGVLPRLEEAHDAIKRIVDGDDWKERWAALGAEPEEREGLRDETRKFMAAVKARFRHMRENYRRFKKAMQDTDHE